MQTRSPLAARLGALAALAAGLTTPARAQLDDPLWSGFAEPPPRARPFVRWWWNGPAVERAELARELELFAAAGLGGVEINTVGPPPGSAELADCAVWLSPEWIADVAFAARKAAELGLAVDLLIGAGWPWGGDFLTAEERLRALAVTTLTASGPAELELGLAELGLDAPGAQLEHLWLTPWPERGVAAYEDLAGRLALGPEGARVRVPAGKHALHAVVSRASSALVKLPAPGAQGTPLDPFDAGAVRRFLERVSGAFEAAGAPLGGLARAAFCDSFELGEADWARDLETEFRARRGYALGPWLPGLAGNVEVAPEASATWRALLARARHDRALTLSELFDERCVRTFAEWCREQGVLSRLQAHGTPWLHAAPAGYAAADIPEGETWLFQLKAERVGGREGLDFEPWNRFAASAAHQAGRALVACELATNVRGVFRATLADVDAAAALSFASGANHLVLHGYSYSPKDAPFPGWLTFGTWFSERNAWWPHFADWVLQTARVAHVLQAGRPALQVALLPPLWDVRAESGLDERSFRLEAVVGALPSALAASGRPADFIGPEALRGASLEDGQLVVGSARYSELALCSLRAIDLETASAIAELVRAGLPLVALDGLPSASPGLPRAGPAKQAGRLGGADKRVRATFAKLAREHPERVSVLRVPRRAVDARARALATWVREEWPSRAVHAAFECASPDLFCAQRETEDGRLVLFSFNASQSEPLDCAVRVARAGEAWHWNARDGTRRPVPGARALPAPAETGAPAELAFDLCLAPREQRLTVIEPARAAAPSRAPRAAFEVAAAGPWELELCAQDGAARSFAAPALDGLPRLDEFSGLAIYRARVRLPEAPDTAGARAELALEGCSGSVEAFWDGVSLGVSAAGRRVFELPGCAPGEHALELRLATSSWWHARRLFEERPSEALARGSWDGEPPPIPGLAGPVTVRAFAPE